MPFIIVVIIIKNKCHSNIVVNRLQGCGLGVEGPGLGLESCGLGLGVLGLTTSLVKF